jgi:hypothetical protein
MCWVGERKEERSEFPVAGHVWLTGLLLATGLHDDGGGGGVKARPSGEL